MIKNINTPQVKTVSIGNGPTGIGLLLEGIQRDNLQDLLQGGYGIIGPKEKLGSGDLGYNCKANSAGRDFYGHIPQSILQELQNNQPYKTLQEDKDDLAPLEVAAKFEGALGDILYKIIQKEEGAHYFNTTASQIIIDKDDIKAGAKILGPDGNPVTEKTYNIISAIGGKQVLADELKQYEDKVLFSDDFFKKTQEKQEKFSNQKVVLKGGAHSAFSALYAIIKNNPQKEVIILNRDPVKVYYSSYNDALQEGYTPTADDIIDEENGAINRYVGIRGDAKE